MMSNKDVTELENPTRFSTVRTCPQVPLPDNFATLPVLTREQISSRIVSGQLLVVHLPLVYRIPTNWLALHPGGDLAILHYVGRDASNEIEVYHAGKTVKQRMARWIVGKVETNEEGWRDMVPPIQVGMWPIPVPQITVSIPTTSSKVESPVTTTTEGVLIDEEKSTSVKFLTPALIDPISPPSDLLPLTPGYQHHLRQSHRKLHARMQSAGLLSPPPFLAGYGPSLLIYCSLFLGFVYTYTSASSLLGYVVSAVFLGAWLHQITFVAHDLGT